MNRAPIGEFPDNSGIRCGRGRARPDAPIGGIGGPPRFTENLGAKRLTNAKGIWYVIDTGGGEFFRGFLPPGPSIRSGVRKLADDTLSEDETDVYIKPGEPGHNQPKEVVWERWTKKRTFVRALEGTYGEVYKSLYTQPRVYTSKDWKWKGGPQNYGKKIINPQSVTIAQAIECHLDVYAPGGYGQKHGHMNSAVFYVLKGRGHDVHDGRHIRWQAGEALIIENGCVHQHFNDDPDESTVVLIMKAKPLFLFMHMVFQKVVEYPPQDPVPGHEDFRPPDDL